MMYCFPCKIPPPARDTIAPLARSLAHRARPRSFATGSTRTVWPNLRMQVRGGPVRARTAAAVYNCYRTLASVTDHEWALAGMLCCYGGSLVVLTHSACQVSHLGGWCAGEMEIHAWHGTSALDPAMIYNDKQVRTVANTHTPPHTHTVLYTHTQYSVCVSVCVSPVHHLCTFLTHRTIARDHAPITVCTLRYVALRYVTLRYVVCTQDGFMMQFAAAGFWGRGIYFAKNAAYSWHYSYAPDGHTVEERR